MDLTTGFGKIDDRERDTGVAVAGGARPVNQCVLTVCVDDEDALPFFMECGAEMHGNRALADATFLLSDCNDFCGQFPLLFLVVGILQDDIYISMKLSLNHYDVGRSAEVYAHKGTARLGSDGIVIVLPNGSARTGDR
jgi:hypothetical protein